MRLDDYRIAYDIMVTGILSSTMLELPKGPKELYERLRELAGGRANREGIRPNEVRFTQRDIREMTGYGQSWIREALRKLVDYEYLSLGRNLSRGERGQYRLVADEPIAALNLDMIPTPEAMAARIAEL